MGISLELWRARIGGYSCGDNSSVFFAIPLSKLVSGIFLSITIILLLLVIGNIEPNPGPEDWYPCHLCDFKAKTPQQNVRHQRVHSESSNFSFRCPLPQCFHSYNNFKSAQAHLSHHNIGNLNEVLSQATAHSKCAYCNDVISCNRAYCKHLKQHLKNGLHVSCPLSPCSRSDVFTSHSVFSSHLSQCHPGWLEDYTISAFLHAVLDPQGQAHDSHNAGVDPQGQAYEPYDASSNDVADDSVGLPTGNDGSDSDSASTCNLDDDDDDDNENILYDHDAVVTFIGHFYAFLEGKKIVPTRTVNALARKLAFISEILKGKLKRDLKRTLNQAGLSEAATQDVIDSVTSNDPLYNSHHLHARGPTLLTSQRRTTYYRKNFKHQAFKEINLKKNPQDSEDKLHYVDIKESLKIMLSDPTVQKEVNESFSSPKSNGTVLRDYRDGSVYRNSSTPTKTIDLLFFMDAFSCSNPLGSAKRKYKMHGMYMTLGNLKTHLRSFLKSMRLVLLVNDKSLKKEERMYKKAFRQVMKDLKDLETNGIEFNGERVSVRLQLIQGDNLGQHTLGGFVESFTNTFFCRFCDKHYNDFTKDVAVENPEPCFGNLRTPESFNEDLHQKEIRNIHNHKGVKRKSPFHKLNHFHVCDPRLPPCVSHDLFISGVGDHDVRSMIDHFVKEKWFTLHELNMRIRRFRLLGKDTGNRPAELPEESEKLGGHAVQNWTLIRLLPLLIYDRIKPEDPIWKLFLLFKSILELVCAPALANHQVEVMRELIKEYYKKRTLLPNSHFLPKHHFFSHYPDLFLRFGPLIHLWTMAFEHRHQFFKRVAKICRNFVNLGQLLVKKYLLLQAYENMGPLFPEAPVFGRTSPLQHEELSDELQEFLGHSGISQDAVIIKNLTLNQITYKDNDWLLLGLDQSVLSVGQIQLLVFENNVCSAIVKKYQAKERQQYGYYYVPGDSHQELCSIVLDKIENPVPHPVYEIQGRHCLSLKHVFVAPLNDENQFEDMELL